MQIDYRGRDAWPGVEPGRRRIMQANPGRGTRPETALRSALHRRGLRFRVNARIDLPGGRARPDIVFTRPQVAVFVDGCFWHSCPIHGSAPKTRADYWLPKLAATRARDSATTARLEKAGWTVIRVWEHEDVTNAADRIAAAAHSAATGTDNDFTTGLRQD